MFRRHGNPVGARLVLSHANGLAADAYYPFWSLLCDRFDPIRVARRFRFVDAVPRSATGRILKGELRRLYRDG